MSFVPSNETKYMWVEHGGEPYGAGSGARTRDLRMSQTPQGACTSYDRLEGCPMSPTRYQLRHPGLSRG